MRLLPGVSTLWSQAKELGMLLLVGLAFVVYVNWKSDAVLQEFRSEINELGRSLCEASKESDNVGHYNSALDALILDLEKRRDENVQRGDWSKALINVQTAESLKLAKLKPPNPDCSRPLLRGGG